MIGIASTWSQFGSHWFASNSAETVIVTKFRRERGGAVREYVLTWAPKGFFRAVPSDCWIGSLCARPISTNFISHTGFLTEGFKACERLVGQAL